MLSGLAPENTLAGSRPRTSSRNSGDWRLPDLEPYLASVGAPRLRFREPTPVPEPAPRPVAVGPPVAGLSTAEAAVAVANVSALRIPASDDAKPVAASVPKGASPPPVAAKPAPAAILPDDTRPQIRAEDFLPFFQIPGTAQPGDSTIIPSPRTAPGPAALPPSSATYIQTPK